MKTKLITITLFAASCFAQEQTLTSYLGTIGSWPICSQVPETAMCVGFQADAPHTFALMIHSVNPQEVAFVWQVSGMLNGVVYSQEGVSMRADNVYGWSSVALSLPVGVMGVKVSVKGLVLSGT
jgi:hypothetical protein